MSKPSEGMPPRMRKLIEAIMSGEMPDGEADVHIILGSKSSFDESEGEAHRCNSEWHLEEIKQWEDIEENLTAKFGKMAAADLVELQRMGHRFCRAGYPHMNVLLGTLSRLMLLSSDCPAAMVEARSVLVGIYKTAEAFTAIEKVISAKIAANMEAKRARAEANSKHEAEPGTKSHNESKAEAKARVKAEAKAARRNGKAENN